MATLPSHPSLNHSSSTHTTDLNPSLLEPCRRAHLSSSDNCRCGASSPNYWHNNSNNIRAPLLALCASQSLFTHDYAQGMKLAGFPHSRCVYGGTCTHTTPSAILESLLSPLLVPHQNLAINTMQVPLKLHGPIGCKTGQQRRLQ